jgi:very-short-patch-repair endonuclease
VLRDAGVPTFARQVEVADRAGPIGRVDFLRGPVVIEVVGRRWHLDRFDGDHRRYARLAALGLHVLTFTFDDIELRPGHVVSTTGDALARVA